MIFAAVWTVVVAFCCLGFPLPHHTELSLSVSEPDAYQPKPQPFPEIFMVFKADTCCSSAKIV